MRIYFDEQSSVIVIERARMQFAPKSLSVTYIGNRVTVWQADQQTRVVVSDFSKIKNKNGAGFGSVSDCVAYLGETFSKSADDNAPDFLSSVLEILS